jgi:hypothetical protein
MDQKMLTAVLRNMQIKIGNRLTRNTRLSNELTSPFLAGASVHNCQSASAVGFSADPLIRLPLSDSNEDHETGPNDRSYLRRSDPAGFRETCIRPSGGAILNAVADPLCHRSLCNTADWELLFRIGKNCNRK